MKIEKINDNQIKCILNKSDLADRQIKMSELAYGTDKAKKLFQDMMQQAANEFGFEAEDIPLMIEAIPVSADCIILVITKVDNPEELDTRFSRFSPSDEDDEDAEPKANDVPFLDFANVYSQVMKEINSKLDAIKGKKQEDIASVKGPNHTATDNIIKDNNDSNVISIDSIPSSDASNNSNVKEVPVKGNAKNTSARKPLQAVFTFNSIDDIIKVAGLLKDLYSGVNSLYKDETNSNRSYYLSISQSNHSAEEFAIVCNILSEYGSMSKYNYASEAYYKEHFKKMISSKALQKLAEAI